MTGTLYLILLCQLPVWTLLKLDYLVIFAISQFLFPTISYYLGYIFFLII